MTWILIALILVVAFGPVMWLVPSKRDKRLAAMRSRARADGLVVEMRRIPNPDPTPADRVSPGGKVRAPVIECASYGLPLGRTLKFLPGWRLVRKAAVSGDDPLPDWQYDVRPSGDGRIYQSEVLGRVQGPLERLPGDVLALEVSPRMLLSYWLEKPGSNEQTVGDLAAILRDLEVDLTGLDARIEAQRNNDDS